MNIPVKQGSFVDHSTALWIFSSHSSRYRNRSYYPAGPAMITAIHSRDIFNQAGIPDDEE